MSEQPKSSPIQHPIHGSDDPFNGSSDPINGSSDPINGSSDAINGSSDPLNESSDPINGSSDPNNGQSNTQSLMEVNYFSFGYIHSNKTLAQLHMTLVTIETFLSQFSTKVRHTQQ